MALFELHTLAEFSATLAQPEVVRVLKTRLSALAGGLLLISALTGCACRPGFVGPYGGVHPPRCWIG